MNCVARRTDKVRTVGLSKESNIKPFARRMKTHPVSCHKWISHIHRIDRGTIFVQTTFRAFVLLRFLVSITLTIAAPLSLQIIIDLHYCTPP